MLQNGLQSNRASCLYLGVTERQLVLLIVPGPCFGWLAAIQVAFSTSAPDSPCGACASQTWNGSGVLGIGLPGQLLTHFSSVIGAPGEQVTELELAAVQLALLAVTHILFSWAPFTSAPPAEKKRCPALRLLQAAVVIVPSAGLPCRH